MSKLKFLSAAAIALAMVACGSSSNNTDGGAVTGTDGGTTMTGTDGGMTGTDAGMTGGSAKIDISGTASPFPLSAANAADFSSLTIAIVDPAAALTNPNAMPLDSKALDTTAGNCPGGKCAWSFSMVDISNASIGLVAELFDTRTTGQKWVPTATGIATGSTVTAEKSSKAPLTGAMAFAVSTDTEAALVNFVNTANGNTNLMAGGLTAKGFMIGMVLDTAGMPIQGATVNAASSSLTIYYPSADLMTNGTATSADGIFLAVPNTSAAMSVVTNFTVTASGHTFPSSFLAGSNPGSCFVLLFQSST